MRESFDAHRTAQDHPRAMPLTGVHGQPPSMRRVRSTGAVVVRRSPNALATVLLGSILASACERNSVSASHDRASLLRGMARVDAGEFEIGTDDPRSMANERPARKVAVAAFWIDERDV